MAVVKTKLDVLEDWFRQARKELIAEYYDDFRHFSDVVPLMELPGGDSLVVGFEGGIPFLCDMDADGRIVGVVGDDMRSPDRGVKALLEKFRAAGLMVSGPRKEYLLSHLRERWSSVGMVIGSHFRERMEEHVKGKGFKDIAGCVRDLYVRSVELDDRSLFCRKDFFCLARFLSDSELLSVRREALERVDSFHSRLREMGHLSQEEERGMSFYNRSRVEKDLSFESLLLGRLDMLFDNLIYARGECSVYDLAAVSVWAAGRKEFAPLFGPSFESWVGEKAASFEFDMADVLATRRSLGGDVTCAPGRPRLRISKEVRRKALSGSAAPNLW